MNYPNSVLLIDDDDEEHEILFAALRECCNGVELLYEKNGQAAMKRLCDEKIPPPDMVFVDWSMPLASGKDVLATIRTLRHYDSVPVIIYTGSLAPSHHKEAEELGASYFLNKPSGITELRQKLIYLFSLDWKQKPSSTTVI